MAESGIIQLKAKGSQDKYLTENPSISYFIYTYKKYSNFAMETNNLNFTNKILRFNENNNIKIPRIGDLISKIYLNATLEAKNSKKRWGWINNIGNNIINYIEFKIGGNVIDKIYGSWLNIWFELNNKKELSESYNEMIGSKKIYTNIYKDKNTRELQLYIPLNFFFNKFTGSALPLIALQYHEIEMNFKLRNYSEIINYDHDLTKNDWDIIPHIKDASLLVDYIYLDNYERNIFAKSSHEILFDKLQLDKIVLNSNNNQYRSLLYINNPVKILYWTVILDKYINQRNKYLDITLENSTKRFILICICSTNDINKKIIQDITPGSIIKVNENNTISIHNKEGNIYNIGNDIILNKNYKYYDKIVNVLENCVINKKIISDSDNMNIVDYSFIECNKLLDDYTQSIPVNELIYESENTNYVFKSIKRSNVSGGIGTSKYDVILTNYNNYGIYLNKKINPINNLKLLLDNNERIDKLDGNYFNYLQPYLYDYNIPSDGLNMYSFSLFPENYQPSGSLNMSGVNNIELLFELNKEVNSKNKGILYFYTLKYNILRITGGVAGLAYV